MHFNKLFTFLKCFKCGHSNSKRFNSNLTETTNVLMKRLGKIIVLLFMSKFNNPF